jgi:hypothetical protein
VRTSASRVRVLTAHETGTLMRAGGGPYQLSVCAVDSVYTSGETIHAWNYATISPLAGIVLLPLCALILACRAVWLTVVAAWDASGLSSLRRG